MNDCFVNVNISYSDLSKIYDHYLTGDYYFTHAVDTVWDVMFRRSIIEFMRETNHQFDGGQYKKRQVSSVMESGKYIQISKKTKYDYLKELLKEVKKLKTIELSESHDLYIRFLKYLEHVVMASDKHCICASCILELGVLDVVMDHMYQMIESGSLYPCDDLKYMGYWVLSNLFCSHERQLYREYFLKTLRVNQLLMIIDKDFSNGGGCTNTYMVKVIHVLINMCCPSGKLVSQKMAYLVLKKKLFSRIYKNVIESDVWEGQRILSRLVYVLMTHVMSMAHTKMVLVDDEEYGALCQFIAYIFVSPMPNQTLCYNDVDNSYDLDVLEMLREPDHPHAAYLRRIFCKYFPYECEWVVNSIIHASLNAFYGFYKRTILQLILHKGEMMDGLVHAILDLHPRGLQYIQMLYEKNTPNYVILTTEEIVTLLRDNILNKTLSKVRPEEALNDTIIQQLLNIYVGGGEPLKYRLYGQLNKACHVQDGYFSCVVTSLDQLDVSYAGMIHSHRLCLGDLPKRFLSNHVVDKVWAQDEKWLVDVLGQDRYDKMQAWLKLPCDVPYMNIVTFNLGNRETKKLKNLYHLKYKKVSLMLVIGILHFEGIDESEVEDSGSEST